MNSIINLPTHRQICVLPRLSTFPVVASKNNAHISRRERVKRQAMDVEKSLQHLEAAGDHLPRLSLSSYRSSSTSSYSEPETTIYVCQGKHCKKRGSKIVANALQSAAAEFDNGSIEVKGCSCLGQCKRGPAVQIDTKQKSITYVDVDTVEGIKQIAAVAVLE